MNTHFSIGCDPEIFLLNPDNTPKSVIGLIGADKWNPKKISEVGHAVLEDNVAVEFNIPACDSFEAFKKEVKFTMEKIKEMLPKELHFSKESAISFPMQELSTDAAWIFGCEPDFNAYTEQENSKPLCEDPQLRSCGGHIHVGSDVAIANPYAVVRAMDAYLGVSSTKLDHSGKLRRLLYGKAGACRIKPYGVEYRTLSNFWIFDDALLDWAYTGTQRAIEFVAAGNDLTAEERELVQDCINNGNENIYGKLARFN